MGTFEYEGEPVETDGRLSIAAALIQAGEPPRLFCAIGVCFACLVEVNGRPAQRACLTIAQPGDVVHAPH